MNENVPELEERMKLALAKLSVAEDLSWGMALFFGIALQLKWGLWWLSVVLALLLRYLAVKAFDRQYEEASDAWGRATGSGKHFGGHSRK